MSFSKTFEKFDSATSAFLSISGKVPLLIQLLKTSVNFS